MSYRGYRSDPKLWSYSRVRSLMDCSFYFMCEYLLKLPKEGPTPTAMVLGSAVHSILETAGKKGIMNVTEDELLEVGLHYWDKNEEVTKGTPNYHKKRARIEAIASHLYKNWGNIGGRPMPEIDPERVEWRPEPINIPGTKGYRLQIYVDAVDEDGVFYDWKTAYSAWGEGKEEEEVQPSFYSLGVNQDLEFRYLIIKTSGTIENAFQWRETNRGLRDRILAKNLFRAGVRIAESGMFIPNRATGWCASCFHKEACAKWMRSPKAIVQLEKSLLGDQKN